MKFKPFVAGIPGALALLLCGCFQERIIVWAPDGSKAVLLEGNDGKKHALRLIDPQGQLTETDIHGVALAIWFPKGDRLLLEQVAT